MNSEKASKDTEIYVLFEGVVTLAAFLQLVQTLANDHVHKAFEVLGQLLLHDLANEQR